jgi:hypothetical protein
MDTKSFVSLKIFRASLPLSGPWGSFRRWFYVENWLWGFSGFDGEYIFGALAMDKFGIYGNVQEEA